MQINHWHLEEVWSVCLWMFVSISAVDCVSVWAQAHVHRPWVLYGTLCTLCTIGTIGIEVMRGEGLNVGVNIQVNLSCRVRSRGPVGWRRRSARWRCSCPSGWRWRTSASRRVGRIWSQCYNAFFVAISDSWKLRQKLRSNKLCKAENTQEKASFRAIWITKTILLSK